MSVSRHRSFVGLALMLPLLLGGAAAAIWFSGRQSTRDRLRRKMDSLRRLRLAIIGSDKSAIAAVLGPPSASAGFGAVAPSMLMRSDYRHADTWYYPLDRSRRHALAVEFHDDIAKNAQLVEAPR